MQRWLEYGFLSFRWWLMLVILVLPWMLCAKAADRIKLPEMLLFGDFIGIFTILLDRVGYYVDFWDYPTLMFPLVPGAWPFDLSIVPVAYMLIHQYFRTWKLFLYAILGMAAVNSFIGEPLSNRMDPVVYYRWKPVYSFFVCLVFGIGTRFGGKAETIFNPSSGQITKSLRHKPVVCAKGFLHGFAAGVTGRTGGRRKRRCRS